MIFDGHLHLSPTLSEGPRFAEFLGALAISRSARENDSYVRAAQKLGLNCAVFVGDSERDIDQVVQWILDGSACAYDHVELLERFEPQHFYSTCRASILAKSPLIIHVSRHTGERTETSLVESCIQYLTENFPELKVVVAHLAGENYASAVRFAKSNANLFFDISKLAETAEYLGRPSPTDLLRDLKDRVPTAQILFGTDQAGPWDPRASVEYSAVREVFSESDSRRVLAANALQIFRQEHAFASA